MAAALAAAALALLAGGAILASSTSPETRPPGGYGAAPAFTLTGQTGAPVESASLAGRVWVAGFIFTRCAGPCPILSTRMAELQAAFPGPDFALVSISVDPAYDTPEVLAAYARRFRADPARWHFLTGRAEDIVALSREGFRLSADADEAATHSTRLVLIDRGGEIRGYYDGMDPKALARLRRDAAALLGR